MFWGGTRREISRASHVPVGGGQRFGRPVEVPPVGVDRAEDHVVLQDECLGHVGWRYPARPSAAAHSREAHHPTRGDLADRVDDHRAHTGALDDDVGLEAHVGDGPGVVGGTEVVHQLRFGALGDPVQDVDVEPELDADHGREHADRAGTGDQHLPRLPERARPHGRDQLPGLRDHGGRLEQHREEAERRVHLGEVARLDPPALGHEPVDLLDAPLGVLPVAAHVPFTDRAVGARHRVGASDDPDDQVTGLHAAVRPRVHDPTQRLVAEDQPLPPRGRPAVRARGDLHVRPADAHRHRLDQDRPGALVRFGDLLEANRVRDPRLHRDCLHDSSLWNDCDFVLRRRLRRRPRPAP